jgi:hypothetical protein
VCFVTVARFVNKKTASARALFSKSAARRQPETQETETRAAGRPFL